MFEDKTLVCKDCGKEFVWTAGEQEFYASRGFENQPSAASPAVMPARTLPAVSARCSMPLRQLRQDLQGALPAARRPSGLLQRVLCQDEGERLILRGFV